VLAGDGEMRGEIEARIASAGLGDRVRITGWVDEAEVRRLLLASRGLVLASFAEGLPVVIMEAFALGRPVIATAIAGVPELVRPGESGWLVTAGNAEELAEAMGRMLSADAAALERMGAAGSRRTRERHSAMAEAARLAALLDPCVRRAGG
jgi:glycosyltransferase involved in cell wall biosynthesis